jgi:hypothetical protein
MRERRNFETRKLRKLTFMVKRRCNEELSIGEKLQKRNFLSNLA